jgi:hypothetical protein
MIVFPAMMPLAGSLTVAYSFENRCKFERDRLDKISAQIVTDKRQKKAASLASR